jgi:hypothetical protein
VKTPDIRTSAGFVRSSAAGIGPAWLQGAGLARLAPRTSLSQDELGLETRDT